MTRCACATPMRLGDEIPEGYTGAWALAPSVDVEMFWRMSAAEKMSTPGAAPVHAMWCEG